MTKDSQDSDEENWAHSCWTNVPSLSLRICWVFICALDFLFLLGGAFVGEGRFCEERLSDVEEEEFVTALWSDEVRDEMDAALE